MNTVDLIFTQVSLKCYSQLRNTTGEILLLDYLKKDAKVYILNLILKELKKIIVNLQYYSYTKKHFNYKLDRLLQFIIFKIQIQLSKKKLFNQTVRSYNRSEIHWLLTNLEYEYNDLIKLFFQSTSWVKNGESSFITTSNSISRLLLIAILENLLIQLADIIVYFLFMDSILIREISDQTIYSEILSILSERNNIYWKSYIKDTFLKPKYIYLNVYKIKIINPEGVCTKLLYLPNSRSQEKLYLSKAQSLVLFYIEFIEFLYPKIQSIIKVVTSFFR